ncbi:MAG: glycosyltransferase [Breznakibacter sp.]
MNQFLFTNHAIPIGVLATAAVGGYILMVARFSRIWRNRKQEPIADSPQMPFVSVVVAFKNEASNLSALLNALKWQTYPHEKFEILLVDDSSDDHFIDVLGSYEDTRIQLLHNPGNGKKEAVRHGVIHAKGEIVLVTDADCIPPDSWIKSMAIAFSSTKVQLVIGPVMMNPAADFWERYQRLDFMSLQLSGAAAAMANRPVMCNGASLGFRKPFYLSTSDLSPQYRSGDDMFLLHRAKQMGKEIVFLQRSDAIVTTRPEKTLKDFLRQRIRWASKAKGYTDTDTLMVAFIVALANFALVLLPVLAWFHWPYLVLFVMLLLVKATVENSFFNHGKRFFGIDYSFCFFAVVQLLHPIYTVGVVCVSMFANVKWKGEKVIR